MSEPYPVKRPTAVVLEISWVPVDDENLGGIAIDKAALRAQLEEQLAELEQEWGAVDES